MTKTIYQEVDGVGHRRVKVGISTYNDYEYLTMILQSIKWYTYLEDEGFDLVVCDDGTMDRNPEVFEKVVQVCKQFGATLIAHEKNQGIPATWNHLTMSLGAENEIMVILNNDLLVVPNWLKVAVHFLDANKNNPHLGTCFWNPVNRVPKDMMKAILPTIGHTLFETREQATGRDPDFYGLAPFEAKQGDGQGLGRVMCPCGCCFAFRQEMFQIATFDERLTSFHEESHFGTCLAANGRISLGFAYPRPYHTHGYTFGVNPELQASKRMIESRKLYRELWRVPSNISDSRYFEWVNSRYMTQIPESEWKYLVPDYTQEPDHRSLPGGELVLVPKLVERTGVY